MRPNKTIEAVTVLGSIGGLYFGWEYGRFFGVLSALMCPTLWSLFVYSSLAGLERPDDDPEMPSRVMVPLASLVVTIGLCVWVGWSLAWLVTIIGLVAAPYLTKHNARALHTLAEEEHAEGKMTGPRFGPSAGKPWQL